MLAAHVLITPGLLAGAALVIRAAPDGPMQGHVWRRTLLLPALPQQLAQPGIWLPSAAEAPVG